MAASVVMDALVASLEQCVADFRLKISNGGDADSSAAVVDSLNKELAASLVRRDEIMEYFERKVYSLEEFLERREKLTLGLLLLTSSWRLFPLLRSGPRIRLPACVLRVRVPLWYHHRA